MSAEIKNEKGKISISNTVIATLAGDAATQCYGVVGMCIKTGKDGIASLLKRENLEKGIRVKTVDNKIEIALYIIVEYGVKYHVEKFTGMNVSKVQVFVESVRIENA